ncbi:MAG: LegC family aminotransferase [Bacteroidota bacterium]
MHKFQPIINFIQQLFNQQKGFISLHTPTFIGNEKKYLNECIDTTFVSSVGKFVDNFELKMAEYTGAKKAVSCVNGTNALHLALKLVGVEQGDEVITQPLTFIATCNAISYIGAKPVFVDVDLETMGMSPSALKEWLKECVELNELSQPINKISGKRVAACVPMHTFGHPVKIDEIVSICNDYNIPVIEDAAESLGSFYKEKHTGTYGKIGVLSFNGNKILTTGGGGMLLFNDDILAKRAKHLTTQAKVPHPWEFVHDEIGYNYRMPNINAAIGLAQLEQISLFVNAKRKIALEYQKYFNNSDVKYIIEPKNSASNYWLNCVMFENKLTRDEFLEFSNKNGVMSRPAWQLMNKLEMFKDCQCGKLTNSEYIADRLVNLPSSVIL